MSQLQRRQVLIAAGVLLAAPHLAAAQPGKRTYRVAIVFTASSPAEMAGPNPTHPITRIILHELRTLGYVEGRNLILERRSGEGRPERYPEIMSELLRLETDVIVVSGERSLVRAAKAATSSVPIVTINYSTPVSDGFAASLARPGGNVTGTTG